MAFSCFWWFLLVVDLGFVLGDLRLREDANGRECVVFGACMIKCGVSKGLLLG